MIECIHSTLLNMNEHVCICLRLCLLLLLLLLGFISVGWCQVVAPTWLQQNSRRPTVQAPPVKVTPLNLMETAAIRSQIQKAVNDGTYVVAASPQQVRKYCTMDSKAGNYSGTIHTIVRGSGRKRRFVYYSI